MIRQWTLAVLIVAAATAFLHAPIVVGALTGEARFFEWDVPEQYWPDLVYLCDALHDGELPYWNPYDRAGYPYYADPQGSAYHPLNWAICAAAGPAPHLGWATARTISAFFLCGVFALLWLRRLDVPWSGAVVGAVAMQAAPFMRHNWELNLTTALAYLPLMLWAADRAVVERRLGDGALLALAVALCAWVGSPPALYFGGSFVGLYVIARLVGLAREDGAAALRPAAKTLGVALLLSAGLIAVVIVPGLGLAAHSVQHGRSFASIAAGGLEAGELGALLWPRSGNHLYVGIPVLLLAAVGVLGKRPLRIFFAVVAAVAVVLSLGETTPAFRLAYDFIPGARLFRLPYRYEAWLGPATGALAAFGAAELVRRFEGQPWAPCLGGLGGLGGLGAGGLIALLLLLDVSRSLPTDRHTRGGAPPGSAAAAQEVLPLAPNTDADFRYMDEFGISCRSGTRLRHRDFRGYQDPLSLRAYAEVVDSLRDAPGLAPQFGVRYALTGPHFIHGWNRHYLPPPGELRAFPGNVDRGHGVIEIPEALPFAYWTNDIRRARGPEAAFEMLRASAPAAVAIVAIAGDEADEADESGGSGPPPTPTAMTPATQVALSRDSLSFIIEAPAAGMVVVNEAFYPGWEADISGQPAEVERVNGLVRGVHVSPGRHRIEMHFRPPDGAPLRWLLLASLLASLVILAVTFAAPALARYNGRRWSPPPRA